MKRSSSDSVLQIIECVSIVEVWRALGGGDLRHTGNDHYRSRAFWRDGDGWNVAIDGRRNNRRDHRDNTGGRLLALVSKLRGGSRQDALTWLSDLAGVALDVRRLSAHGRRRWIEERAGVRRNIRVARYRLRAALALGENALAELKAALLQRLRVAIEQLIHAKAILSERRPRTSVGLSETSVYRDSDRAASQCRRRRVNEQKSDSTTNQLTET
jgi:hypothetical protein